MVRKIVLLTIGILVICSALTGCLLNTPEQVVKRFVARMKGVRWEGMAELIDWPESSRNIPGLPASNMGQEDEKTEVMKRIAENFTGFPVSKRTADQIRHEFIYLKVASIKHVEDGRDWASLKVKVTTEMHTKTVPVLVMKIDRLWRIVLTESIFK